MKFSSMLISGALLQTSHSCDCTNRLWLVFDSTRPLRNRGNFCFWNPDCIKFLLWNPESRGLKSGKELLESGIPLPLIKNPEYGTFNLESTQPRTQSSSAISDVMSPVKLVGKFAEDSIALGSKSPLVTRIATTSLSTRLESTAWPNP